MPDCVFTCLNVERLTETIVHAKQRVCYASPGLYDWVAEALVEAAGGIGWDRVRIVLDPNPDVIRFGFGTQEAIHRILNAGGCVRAQNGLRIGVVMVDDFAAVLGPTPLNTEEFPKGVTIQNAITISIDEAERLIAAVAPEMGATDMTMTPEIGARDMTEEQIRIMDESLREVPPVAPDLARLLRVINSQFQIVKLTFDGSKPSQRKVPIKAAELGIEDEVLARRISASFRLFEPDIEQYTEPLRERLDQIKERYHLKSLGELGHMVLGKDRSALESDLNHFNTKLLQAKEQLGKVLKEKLEDGKNRLKTLLTLKLPRGGRNEADLERKIDWIIGRIRLPKPDDILAGIHFDWSILNISEQMICKAEFVKKVEDLYGKPIQELVIIEPAVGLKKGNPS